MALTGPTRNSPKLEETLEARGTTYRVVALQGPEMAPLVPLFRDAFKGRDFNPEELKRKYACEYEGVRGFSCVAFTEHGEAAGSVGLLPWPVRFGDRIELAGQLVDVATGSAHRGRGLFVHLAERVRELCQAAGIAFLYGFPNEAAYPIWMGKLGYEHIDDLVEYRLPVRTLWAEKVARRTGTLRPLYERYVRRRLSTYIPVDPVLGNSLLREGFAGIERDAAFHEYKSSFGGSRVLSVDGGRVWVRFGGGVFVGDLEALSEADMDMTTRAVERLAARLGVHRIVFQVSKGTRFSSFFASRFRTLPGLPVIHRNLDSQIPTERLRFTVGDLDNF